MGFEGKQRTDDRELRNDAWQRLKGALKDVYASFGGGEAYLRAEREAFNKSMERREHLIAEAMGWSSVARDDEEDES